MHSVHSMIQRFRETKPTPRRERSKQRQHGQLTELWWVREGSPLGEDVTDDLGFTQDSLECAAKSSGAGPEKIWQSGLETRRVAHNNHSPASPRLAVDKIMSEDIKSFLATGGYRPNRSPRRAPMVLPSATPTAVSSAPVKTLCASYPLSRLVPTSDREAFDQAIVAPHEEKRHQIYQQRSLALDAPPPQYTGRAELRGEIAPTPSQGDGCLERRHGMVPAQEDAPEAIMPSAAGVTLELDVVMDHLRNEMGQIQQAGCSHHLIPGGDLPRSLAQIGLDLDAQLLEFTLMAKAREQAAAEKAEEAQTNVSRQGETRRLTDKTSEIEDSRDQEEGEDGIFNDVLIAPTKPSWVGIVSPADGNTKDQATNGGMTLVTEGILRTERDQDLGSLIEASPFPNHGRILRRPLGPIMALPSDDEDFPVVPQSWLYGHTTLQQTGQSIGAELEVAMLCMQKRLAKQPIVIGEESKATDVLKQEVVVVKVHGNLEKGSQKDDAVDTEGDNKRDGWPQENLEMLADNMASRTLRETSELDRELGLDFSDDFFHGVGQCGASPKWERGLPAGVYLSGALSPSVSGLDTGAAGAVEEESRPPVSSRSYFPRHITYDLPLSPRGKPQHAVKSKTESTLQNNGVEATATGATNVPLIPSALIASTLAPGDDATFRRLPPTPLRQTEQGGYVGSYCLPRATTSFVGGNAQSRDQGRVNGNIRGSTDHVGRREMYLQRQQQIDEGVDDDAWGPGFALARARRRLRSFQTTRWGTSTSDERHHRLHNESQAQISANQQAVQRQHHVGDQKLLNRLKRMRRAYSLNASPRQE